MGLVGSGQLRDEQGVGRVGLLLGQELLRLGRGNREFDDRGRVPLSRTPVLHDSVEPCVATRMAASARATAALPLKCVGVLPAGSGEKALRKCSTTEEKRSALYFRWFNTTTVSPR